MQNEHKGFTLIEIIATLLILGVLGAVAVSRYSDMGAVLFSRVSVLRVHLRHAQLLAMNTSTVHFIQFSGSTYTLYRYGAPSVQVVFPGEGAAVVDMGSDISISSRGGTVVSFDGWGRPCTDDAGTVLQVGTRTIDLSASGQADSIIITPETGYIP